jgi:hypothetical protein
LATNKAAALVFIGPPRSASGVSWPGAILLTTASSTDRYFQHGDLGVRGGKHHGHVAKTDDLERKADGRFGGPLRDDKTAKIGRTNGPTSNGGSWKLSGVRHGVFTQPRPCANYRFRVLDSDRPDGREGKTWLAKVGYGSIN